eukprot:759477-Rhodomonas_salina.1
MNGGLVITCGGYSADVHLVPLVTCRSVLAFARAGQNWSLRRSVPGWAQVSTEVCVCQYRRLHSGGVGR